MLSLLHRMVAENPTRADSWRLLGRIHRQQGRIGEALDAFDEALRLQPDNAAAHFDLGELMIQLGDYRQADSHFQQVMRLAPQSDYAARLTDRGVQPAATPPWQDLPGESPEIGLVGYEIQTFDGADDLQRRLNQLESDAVPDNFRAFIELGGLYNTNVSLTPISRELAASEAASFQAFFSPDLEWIWLSRGGWRAGPLARGYFTQNEAAHQPLNLASFQPGAFLERDLPCWADCDWIGRMEYSYSVDLLDGTRFGDRHTVTASLTAILPGADVVYMYFTTGVTDFAQDGTTPAVESLDGVSFTTGVSRFFQTGSLWVPTWTLGIDLESADTEGADFRYQAVTLHSDATLQLTDRLSFIPRAGIGYRDYGDFTGTPSRDELTWRASGKLKYQWTECMAISAVVGHDRFASDNAQFDTDRTEAGIVLTIIR